MGIALFYAERGSLSPSVKPLKHIGSGVFEIRTTYKTNTYRAVYAVKIGERIYVLHCFQKKSKKGIETPQTEIDLIKKRLKMAQELEKEYEQKN
ncbi:type II toxin-antitoxin system RelE/ParE family toxin [Candidatus Poribacteria bacterium]|nr:type II toxin-antitoxin system RelE/ParE family toxin [Candidatus Poribacteria bacterium]